MIINDIGSVVGALHTGEVVGSIPTAPTSLCCFAATAGKPTPALSCEAARAARRSPRKRAHGAAATARRGRPPAVSGG
jgi:hypothetical protein